MDIQLFIAGFIAAHTILLLCFKMGIRRVLGYDAVVDILATVLLLWMFQGTYSGMVAGAAGGLIISIELALLKKYLGYEVLTFDPETKTFHWIKHHVER